MLTSGCIIYSSEGNANTAPAQTQQCNAEGMQSYIGQKFTPALSEKLHASANSNIVRVIRPNRAVTMDYNAQRINVHLDKNDKITMITCG